MKIKTMKYFAPVTIELESQRELDVLAAALEGTTHIYISNNLSAAGKERCDGIYGSDMGMIARLYAECSGK